MVGTDLFVDLLHNRLKKHFPQTNKDNFNGDIIE